MNKTIEAITKIDIIKWNEAQLMGRFMMTIGDMEELCKVDDEGLPTNKKLNDAFMGYVRVQCKEYIDNIKKGRLNNATTKHITL